jgi:uncharacterized membrane protein
VTTRHGLAGAAAVIGIYVVTALEHSAPAVPVTVLIIALAVITWCVIGDGPGAVCGVLAAIGGPIVEAVLAGAGVFRYADDSDSLFGVAPWLPALYFAFGVVVAVRHASAALTNASRVRLSVADCGRITNLLALQRVPASPRRCVPSDPHGDARCRDRVPPPTPWPGPARAGPMPGERWGIFLI